MKLNTTKFIALMLLCVAVITSCKDQNKEEESASEKEAETAVETQKSAITLEKLTGSPAYTDAVLELNQPAETENLKGGKVGFEFTVNNYELTAQTAGPNAKMLANSGKGQHIHFILNNQPYSAHYEPNFAKEIPNGVHHLVAFLSRSYHESVKNENSVVVKKLVVGPDAEDTIGLEMDAPTLIYSRPKGEYTGKDNENILLDFFVLNTELAADGNKVKATINGEEFTIAEWAPHIIKGLPVGEVTIKLELIDAEGKPIPGPFNTVERTVMLKE